MLLLVGGTGNLGGRIARRLADRRPAVSRAGAAVDRPWRADHDRRPRSCRGDLRDVASLRAAVEGIDTVIASAHSLDRIMAGHKDLSIRSVDRDGYGNLVVGRDGGRRSPVRLRLVSRRDPGLGNAVRRSQARHRTVARRRRRCTRSIVRPDAYQEPWLSAERGFDWRSGRVTIFGRGDGQAAYVGMDDVAEAVVRLATMPDPPRLVEFGGPESMTRNELVAAFEKALGMPLRRRQRSASPDAARVRGPSTDPPRARLGPRAWACPSTCGQWRPTTGVLRDLGIRARPVSAYIRDLVAVDPRRPRLLAFEVR